MRKYEVDRNRLRIGLFVHPWHEYGRSILRGITRFAQEHGGWELISDWPGGRIMPGQVSMDGLIVRPDPRSKVPLDTGAELPRVLISNERQCTWADLCWDNETLGRLAAEHLLEQGRRSLAVVADPGRVYHLDRRAGFESALARAGLKARRISATQGPRLDKALRVLKSPTGLLAVTDVLARGVMFAAEALGRRIPEDLAVIGIGNDEVFCETLPTPLTSVALPGEELGYQAGAMLARRLAGESRPVGPRPVAGRYVAVRRSTDLIAIDDRMVMRALKLIRDSREDQVSVADIHKAVPLSRRSLELRFRKHVGRTMREEIERVRVEWAKQLLRDTDWPVERIASSAQFSGPSQMWRAFKRLTGLSPTIYRNMQFT